MKTCSKCKIEKSLDEFGKHQHNKDGRRYECLACRRAEYHTHIPEHRAMQRDCRLGKGSTEHLYAQVELQKGCCAICKNAFPVKKGGLGLDHNHKTGQWRGALCSRCNSGVGDFMDDPLLLIEAVKYLNTWGNKENVQ